MAHVGDVRRPDGDHSGPSKHVGQAAEAAGPEQEAVMGQAIPRQQPAVIPPSRFNKLRALLAVALITVGGLTAGVVILANDSDEAGRTSSAAPIGSLNHGDSRYVNPSTGHPTVPFPQLDSPLENRIDGTRYDGAPEEGSAAAAHAQPRVTRRQTFPGLAAKANSAQAD
jgi:hypothetical protein